MISYKEFNSVYGKEKHKNAEKILYHSDYSTNNAF